MLQRFNENRQWPLTAFRLKNLDYMSSSGSSTGIVASTHRGSTLKVIKFSNFTNIVFFLIIPGISGFLLVCVCVCAHTHTHTHIYIYIYSHTHIHSENDVSLTIGKRNRSKSDKSILPTTNLTRSRLRLDSRRCLEEPASNSVRQCKAGHRPSQSIKWTFAVTVPSVRGILYLGSDGAPTYKSFETTKLRAVYIRRVVATVQFRLFCQPVFFSRFVQTETHRTTILRCVSYSIEMGLLFGRTSTDSVR